MSSPQQDDLLRTLLELHTLLLPVLLFALLLLSLLLGTLPCGLIHQQAHTFPETVGQHGLCSKPRAFVKLMRVTQFEDDQPR
jgi:hypothetical protein